MPAAVDVATGRAASASADPAGTVAAGPMMARLHLVPSGAPTREYVPGACNIGPAEIGRRRRSAIVATVVAVGLELILLAVRAPRPVRLLVGLPAAAVIATWLQVVLKFCLGFAAAGVYNFGPLGTRQRVSDPDGRKADLRRVRSLVALALIGGLVIGVVAALVP